MVGQGRTSTDVPSARANGAGRAAVRIDASTVRVIAQTIPSAIGSAVLREDVSSALAADTELALRDIIKSAKVFMRHSRRDKLHVDDIMSALRLRHAPHAPSNLSLIGGSAINYGRGYRPRADTEFSGFVAASTPRFEAVSKGLFFRPDPMLALKDVLSAPVPPPATPAGVEADWLVFDGASVPNSAEASLGDLVPSRDARKHFVTQVPKRRRSVSNELDRYVRELSHCMTAGTEDTLASPDFDRTLASLSMTTTLHPILPALISLYHTVVATNVHEAGSTPRLIIATRVLHAIASNPSFGFEFYIHNVMPALLTTIVGRHLGSGDQLALRTTATYVMRNIITLHGTPLLTSRACKTLVAVMTANSSELPSVHGAVMGLASFGVDVLRVAFLPHVPALWSGIHRIESAIVSAENALVECGRENDQLGGASKANREAEIVARTRSNLDILTMEVVVACDVCAAAAVKEYGCSGSAGVSPRVPVDTMRLTHECF